MTKKITSIFFNILITRCQQIQISHCYENHLKTSQKARVAIPTTYTLFHIRYRVLP